VPKFYPGVIEGMSKIDDLHMSWVRDNSSMYMAKRTLIDIGIINKLYDHFVKQHYANDERDIDIWEANLNL
jgi:hypothetical protein